MTVMVEAFRQLYNTIRPHETLAGDRPIERYLADPNLASHDPTATVKNKESLQIP